MGHHHGTKHELHGKDDHHSPHSHHSHHHSHGPHDHGHLSVDDLQNASRGLKIRFYTGILLNLGFVIVEAASGFIYNSMALLADAGHNLSDVVGLLLALVAVYFKDKRATGHFTYGFGRVTILVSLVNAVLILVAAGALGWETIKRFGQSPEVPGLTLMAVAGIGFLINTATGLLFFKGRQDLNVRGAFLHMAADAMVSLGVVLGGWVLYATGWSWIDPVLSSVIVVVIVLSSISLLKDSLRLTLDGAPPHVSIDGVREYFDSIQEASSFHDLHVWALSTTSTALSVHLRIEPGIISQESGDRLLRGIQQDMQEQFGIDHSTVQLEGTDFDCDRPGQCGH